VFVAFASISYKISVKDCDAFGHGAVCIISYCCCRRIVLVYMGIGAGLLETPRLQRLLSLARFVISEDTDDSLARRDFQNPAGGVVFVPYEQVRACVCVYMCVCGC
jgi:hypothetical protein